MTFFNCENKYECTGLAFVASLIIGIVAAFLQITAVIALPAALLTGVIVVAILYLAVVLLVAALVQRSSLCANCCSALSATLFGIIGTFFAAIILSLIDFAATSIIGAIVVGVLFFFIALTIFSIACLAKCFLNCRN